MAYKDILPQTNLDATDIRDTIGCPSNNLADYCVRAKAGGTSGYAFQIVENGYLHNNGYLIGGASPYFNIYSDGAPTEWVVDQNTNAVCRLKRNTYGDIVVPGKGTFNSTSYCFDLGSYRGYVHKSKAPHPFSLSAGATPMESGQYLLSIGFLVPGDYPWHKLAPNINTNELYYSIESADVNIPHNDSTMTPYAEAAHHFGIGVEWVGNYPPSRIRAQLGLYRKQTTNKYAIIAYIPMEGSESGNTGGSVEINTPVTVLPTPKPMAVTSVVVTGLIGHPYLISLYGYTVGEPENTTTNGTLNYRIRWKPDEPIKRSTDIHGYVYDRIVATATVGMSTAPNISRAEAEQSGGAFNMGDATWYFSGSVDISQLQYLRPRPESLTLKVDNVIYDNNY